MLGIWLDKCKKERKKFNAQSLFHNKFIITKSYFYDFGRV